LDLQFLRFSQQVLIALQFDSFECFWAFVDCPFGVVYSIRCVVFSLSNFWDLGVLIFPFDQIEGLLIVIESINLFFPIFWKTYN